MYTLENLRTAVEESNNWTDVCKKLKLNKFAGQKTFLKKKCKKYHIATDHFIKTPKLISYKRISLENYFNNKNPIASCSLRKLLFNNKLKEKKCEICAITEWHGEVAPLELDHKDSNNMNNSLDNLQILCANCHSIKTRKTRALNKQLNREMKEKTEVKVFTVKVNWPARTKLKQLINSFPLEILQIKLGIVDIRQLIQYCKRLKIDIPLSIEKSESNQYDSRLLSYIAGSELEKPTKEQLIEDLQSGNFAKVGKKYNVADNTIRKWCKSYGMSIKSSDYRVKKIKKDTIHYKKLTDDEKEEIRRIYIPHNKEFGPVALGLKYGVSKYVITKIANKK